MKYLLLHTHSHRPRWYWHHLLMQTPFHIFAFIYHPFIQGHGSGLGLSFWIMVNLFPDAGPYKRPHLDAITAGTLTKMMISIHLWLRWQNVKCQPGLRATYQSFYKNWMHLGFHTEQNQLLKLIASGNEIVVEGSPVYFEVTAKDHRWMDLTYWKINNFWNNLDFVWFVYDLTPKVVWLFKWKYSLMKKLLKVCP